MNVFPASNAWLNLLEGLSGAPLVTVWVVLGVVLVQVTLAPRKMLICAGSNAKADVIETALALGLALGLAGAAGLAEQATSRDTRMAVARRHLKGTPRQATPSPAGI